MLKFAKLDNIVARAAILRNLEPKGLPADFDISFYRDFNDDLPANTSDVAAKWHYVRFGRTENRPANREAFLGPLEQEFGPLPEGFQGVNYQRLNPDIAEKIPNVWAATEHFLRYGRREGRQYAEIDLELYRALNNLLDLHADDDLAAHYKANIDNPRFAKTGADFMRRRGLKGGGAWLSRLKLEEFSTLNWRWAPKAMSKLEAADQLLSEGLQRLAPLSFDDAFEAAYYRDAHPDLASLTDAGLYEHWLFTGLETNEAGSSRSCLKRLGLSLDAYPDAFDWRLYVRRHPLLKQNRWAALKHLVHSKPAGSPPPLVPDLDGFSFLVALAASFSGRADDYSILLARQAASLADLPAEAQQVQADCLFRQKAWATASELYAAIAASSNANVWTIVNGAKAFLHCEKVESALRLLQSAAERFRGDEPFRSVIGEVMEALFKAREASARTLYLAGARDRADALLLAAVQEIHSLWTDLDPIGAETPAFANAKIVVMANTDLPQCTHYRVEQKAEILKLMGRKFEIYSAAQVDAFMASLPGAAAAIFYRVPAFPRITRAIEAARALGVPTYYEIDDLVFGPEYPDPLDSYGGSISESEHAGLLFGVPLFREAMRRCDFGISSTADLAQQMQPIVRTGEVFVVVNGLDSRTKLKAAPKSRLRRDDDIVIFYGSGTKAHNADFLELAGPALLKAMADHPNVRLMIVGFLVLDARFDAHQDKITRIGFVPNAQAYWSVLTEADINLAVLRPGPVTNGKSEIKWLEAAALSIPSIVSDTATYLNTLEDGVDVLIARSPEDWARHLESLICDPKRRLDIAKAAKAKALSTYSLEANARRLSNALQSAQARRSQGAVVKRAGRPGRVLLTNVFFPPQTIGGATRVVRDNLDYFLDRNVRGFEFAVASSDMAEPEPYRLRVDAYRGAPVFRVSTPQEMNMDWRPFNPQVGAIFGQILDSWKPDLVHFHATQRLTASCVKACRRRRIPHVITVHDAWWISDYQFLIDDHGDLIDPAELVPVRFPRGVSLGDSLARRREFLTLLKGAEAVLGVSQSFSDLYQRCGVPCIALPNGVKRSRPPAKKPSPSGRVRLAHVGGQSAHKGYNLLRAALLQGRFSNLELTVVDHHRSGGSTTYDVWGSTPIKYVGMTAQENMADFYSEQDVLLAPSIWPESFGLVAREGLAAGLWVVASDRGAMGEDVVTGVNGWVIDVASPEALFKVFSLLNETPLKYQTPPPTTPLRDADEQGSELLQLYDDLIERASPKSAHIRAAGGSS